MMDNQFEIIEKFIDNELEGEQLQWFQDQLRTNKDFVAQYKLHIDINEAIKEEDVIALREKLNEIYESVVISEKRQTKVITLRKLSIAASIIILVGISAVIYVFSDKQYSNEDLFASYYAPYETITNVRSGNAATESLISSGFNHYKNSNYLEALADFYLILQDEPDNKFVMFYSAIAEIESDKVGEAIKKFQQIIKDNDSLFIQQSEWYLGLCYLKTNQNTDAKKVFTSIINKDGYYKAMASEIIDKLD